MARSFGVRLALLGLVSGLAGCSGAGGVKSALNVEILATPEAGAFPLLVTLKANVDGEPASEDATYEWDLGDQTTSDESMPAHTYPEIGTYTVKLTLTQDGRTGYAEKEIDVSETGPGTDLAVEAIEVTPLSVNPSSPVTVKVTMRNRGDTAYDHNFISRIFLTTEEELEPGATPNGSINTSGIGGSESLDKTATITIPSSFALADYWVFVVLDAAEAIDETDENNNVGRSVQQLSVTSSSLPIDLVASAPTAPATLTAGATASVQTTLTNLGTADAGPFTVKVMLSADPTITADDFVLHTASIAGLDGLTNEPMTFQPTVPATVVNRPWYLGVLVDTGSAVAETDETNNLAAASGLFTTTGGSGCTEDANEPNEIETQAMVLGTGSIGSLTLCGATTDWWKFVLGAGDRLTSKIDFVHLNGNLEYAIFREGVSTPIQTSATTNNVEQVSSGIALTAGNYLLRVTMGGSGSGNGYTVTNTLEDNGGPGIDLMPTAIQIGSGSGPIPQNVPTQTGVTIYNFGATAATSFDVQLYLSTDPTYGTGDTMLDTFNVASLAAGASVTVTRTVTIPASTASGYYYLIAHSDSANVQLEDHESNNDFALKIGIGTGCLDDAFEPNETIADATPIDNGTFQDLAICQGGSSYGDVYAITTGPGGTITVKIEFVHSSTGDLDMVLQTSSGSTPSPCSSPNQCGSYSTTSVEEVKYTSTTGGTYYVKVYGYSSSTNTYTMTVSGSTGGMPDYAPSTVAASPTSVDAGEDVQVTAKIKNNSTQATPAFDWTLRLSTDTTIDSGDLLLATVSETALGAGENRSVSKKVTIPVDQAGGQYYVGLTADPANAVEEGSELNNIATTATKITVTALCDEDGYEENDTFAGSAPLAVGGTVNGLRVCTGDADWFAFTPSSNGSLTITATFTHANGDLDMRLYQASTVAYIAASTSIDDNEQITVNVTAGTTYRLKVYGFQGATNAYSLGSTLTP